MVDKIGKPKLFQVIQVFCYSICHGRCRPGCYRRFITRSIHVYVINNISALRVIILAAMVGVWIHKSSSIHKGMVNAGSYADLIGKDFETVEAHFEAAGFNNIELIDIGDSGITFWKNGKVDSVSVGGDMSFDSMDWFDPNTKVIISYH